jgi:hypothetical protein
MRISVSLLLCAALLFSGPTRAQQPAAGAAERQVLILVRALAYDRNLKARAGDALVIAVLGKADDEASRRESGAVIDALRALGGVKVQGLPLRAARLQWAGAADLEEQIRRLGVDAVYVSVGLSAEVPAIREVCRKHKALGLGGNPADVRRGLALGAFVADGRSTILVNLPESREGGADLGAELLRLAEVIR